MMANVRIVMKKRLKMGRNCINDVIGRGEAGFGGSISLLAKN